VQCSLNEEGYTVLHRNKKTDPALLLKVIAPYREDVVIAVECIFTWYWLADLCAREGIPFVLGMRFTFGGTIAEFSSSAG